MNKILKTDKGLINVKEVEEPTVVIEEKHYRYYLVNARWKREPQAAMAEKELYDFNTFTIKALYLPSELSCKKFALSKGAINNELTITAISKVPKNWKDEK